MPKLFLKDCALAFYVIIVSIFSLHFGMYQFGGYDLSPLIDLQARLSHGEIPGKDFIYTFPLSIAFLLKIYGLFSVPSFASLIWINIALFGVCAALVNAYWPAIFPAEKKLLTLILMSLPVVFTSHLWHSAMSQLLAIVYSVLALHVFLVQDIAKKYTRNILLALVAGLLFFSKQNLGLPLIGASCSALFLLSLCQPKIRPVVCSFIAWNLLGIAVLSVLFMVILGIPFHLLIDTFTAVLGRRSLSQEQIAATFGPFHVFSALLYALPVYVALIFVFKLTFVRAANLIDMSVVLIFTAFICFCSFESENSSLLLSIFILGFLSTYLIRFYRAGDQTIGECAIIFYILILGGFKNFSFSLCIGFLGFLSLFLVSFSYRSNRSWAERIILFSCLMISFIPVVTDWDSKFNDASLLLFSLLLLSEIDTFAVKRAAIVLSALLLLSASWGGITRERMRAVGPGVFWESTHLTRVEEGYFTGLYAGPYFHNVRHEMQWALQNETLDKSRVFCGPRIEFCYMDNTLRSPHLLPLWWHPGTSYPLTAEESVFKQFKANNFTLLFFLHDDRTRMPLPILDYIEKTYVRLDGYDVLDVYHLRQ